MRFKAWSLTGPKDISPWEHLKGENQLLWEGTRLECRQKLSLQQELGGERFLLSGFEPGPAVVLWRVILEKGLMAHPSISQ